MEEVFLGLTNPAFPIEMPQETSLFQPLRIAARRRKPPPSEEKKENPIPTRTSSLLGLYRATGSSHRARPDTATTGAGPAATPNNRHSLVPVAYTVAVSYTHLDVYKRQI